jgi:hypothetical protein
VSSLLILYLNLITLLMHNRICLFSHRAICCMQVNAPEVNDKPLGKFLHVASLLILTSTC